MPDTTPILQLPYILPSQAQKHVTHNEAIRVLDVIVQLAVTARNLAAPPASPTQGDRYIVAAGASGAWAGKAGQIALYDSGAWQFFVPVAGWSAYVTAEQVLASYTGSAWVTAADGPMTVAQLGVSATPNATNRLSVSSPATLLNHAGAGHQVKVNKAAASDTASLVFQTGFSGRAEMGTTGGDDFAIKVSADGSTFVTGLSIAAATGAVTLPAALRLGGQASDPASPANGTIWLNSTTGEVKMRSNGATVVIANGGVGLTDGDKGHITVSATGTVWTIDAGVISNDKLANVPTATLKGRIAAGTGLASDLTAAEVASILPAFGSAAKGLAPASGGGTSNYLRADGTWASPPGTVATLPSLGVSASAAQINQSATAFPNGFFMGENANLAVGAADVASTSFWQASASGTGVTATKSASGVDAAGVPWVEYTVTGTATAATLINLFAQTGPFASAASGQSFTFGGLVSLMSGTVSGAGAGLRIDVNGWSATSGGAFVERGSTAVVASAQSTVTQASYTLGNATSLAVRAFAVVVANTGAVFTNAVFRVSALQLDRGTARVDYRYMPATPAQARTALGIAATTPAWASITSTGTIEQGAGIASVSVVGAVYTVTLATAMPTATYGVFVTPTLATAAARFCTVSGRTTTQFTVTIWNSAGTATATGFFVKVIG